jgi:hypothetical protein
VEERERERKKIKIENTLLGLGDDDVDPKRAFQ